MLRTVIITTLTVLVLVTMTAGVISHIQRIHIIRHAVFPEQAWVNIWANGGLLNVSLRWSETHRPNRTRKWQFCGLFYSDSIHRLLIESQRQIVVELPFWMMFLLFLAYPCLAFIRGPMRRYGRKRRGRCSQCGYDLTGNTSGRCPECGKGT